MVIDTLSHAGLYHSLGPGFAAGLEWLRTFQPATSDGRYDIKGDDVFALVQSYDTVPPAEKKYESNKKAQHNPQRAESSKDPLCGASLDLCVPGSLRRGDCVRSRRRFGKG